MKNKFDKNRTPGTPDINDTERFWKSPEAEKSRLKFNGVRMTDSAENKGSRLSGTLSGTLSKKDTSKNDNITKESTGTGAFYSAGNLSLPSKPPATIQ